MATRPMFKRPFGNKEGPINVQREVPSEIGQIKLPEPDTNPGRRPVFNLGKKKIREEDPTPLVLQKKQQQPVSTNKIMMRPNLKKATNTQLMTPAQQQQKKQDLYEDSRGKAQFKTPFGVGRKSARFKQAPRDNEERIIIAEVDEQIEKIPQKPRMSQYENQETSKQFSRPFNKPKRGPTRKPMAEIQQVNNFENKIHNSLADEQEINKQLKNPMNDFKINLAELQIRNINLDSEKHVSQGKIQKQRERANNLKRMLNLQIDGYEQTLNLGSITQYELYINKIKSGYINNSLDQAFDDTAQAQCQTLPMSFQDFSQQCPDDINKTFLNDKNTNSKQYQSIALYNFISKSATVMQQLLRPSKTFAMPPIYLLSLNPNFISLAYCPYPTFLYKTADFSIIAIGQKLYVARGEITTIYGMGKALLGGTKEGGIFLWTGQTERGSFYDSVYSLLNNSDFELPSFSTESIEKQSYYKNFSPIVKIVEKNTNEFYSVEEFGKIILWRIATQQNKYGQLRYMLKPLSYISLTSLYSDINLLCFDMEKDTDGKLYISSTRGIIRADASRGTPQIYITQSRCNKLYIPKRGNLIYAINNDNSISIYDKGLSNCLLKIDVNTKGKIVEILIPKIEVDSRDLEIFKGNAFHFNLLENKSEPKAIITNQNSEDKKFLYSCVSIQDSELEFLYVTRQLRTTLVTQNLPINLDKTPKNFKRIIDDNKRLKEILEESIWI